MAAQSELHERIVHVETTHRSDLGSQASSPATSVRLLYVYWALIAKRSIRNFFSFFKMAASSHFGSRFLPKSIGTYLYSRSVARSNMKLIGAFLMKLWSAQAFSSYFHKMAVGGHFGFSAFLQNR